MLHKRHAPMETRLKSGADVSRLLGRRSEHISGQSDDRAAVIFIRYIISSPVITFQNSDAKLRKRSAHSRVPGPDEHGASGVRHRLNLECCESYKDHIMLSSIAAVRQRHVMQVQGPNFVGRRARQPHFPTPLPPAVMTLRRSVIRLLTRQST